MQKRLNRVNLDVREVLAKHTARARNRTAGTDTCDKSVQLAVMRLNRLYDLRTGRLAVDFYVCLVLKLLCGIK